MSNNENNLLFVKVIGNWVDVNMITDKTNAFLQKLRSKGAVVKNIQYSYGNSSHGVMIEYYARKNVDEE